MIGLILLAQTAAAADAVQCPARVEARQQISAPVPGWSVSAGDEPHLLAGITFYDGKPEEKASLAPDSETKRNGKTISTWTFASGEHGTWLACRYAWTSVVLTRELPKRVTKCSVVYNTRQEVAGLPEIESIDCK